MSAPEFDTEVAAIKIGAVLDYVLARIPSAVRSVMPMLTPAIDAEFVHIVSGSLVLASVPLWWIRDGDDWLLPSMQAH